MKELLSDNNIDFRYVDITESMFNLKRFLKYRDNNEVFDNIRKKNRIGIPAIMINNGKEFFFSMDEENLDKLR
ncbi:MAG TPA: glutaredoxin [Tissierellaceae bacterium]|nr:glutaredoxin [Tissierellaceae bacterium]